MLSRAPRRPVYLSAAREIDPNGQRLGQPTTRLSACDAADLNGLRHISGVEPESFFAAEHGDARLVVVGVATVCCRRRHISGRAVSPHYNWRWRGRFTLLVVREAARLGQISGASRDSLVAYGDRRGRRRPYNSGAAVGVGIFRGEPDRLVVVGDGAVVRAPFGNTRCGNRLRAYFGSSRIASL